MKKIDLIHTTILIIAILAGYQSVQNLVSLLSIVAFVADAPVFKAATEQLIYVLILIVSMAAICVILVKNGRKYAGLILKDDPEGSWEDAPKWDLDRRNILLALFIGMGLHALIQTIPSLLDQMYTLFTAKIGSNGQQAERRDSLIIELLKALIGFILIYAAPTLINFIDKSIAVRLDAKDSAS